METFLTVVLIVVLGIWLLRRLMPLLLVALLRRVARKGGGAFYTSGNFGGAPHTKEPEQRAEGKVTIEVLDLPERQVSASVGQYVEYAEEKEEQKDV